MLTVLVLLFLLIVLGIAAMRWGFISSDGPESEEWERRRQYAWRREYPEALSTRHVVGKCKLEKSEACSQCM